MWGDIMKFPFAAALIVGLGVAQNATAANLLVNGGFEAPAQGPTDYAAFNVGTQYPTTYIPGWTVIQGNVDLTRAVDYGPLANTLDPASVQDIDLIGDSSGSGGVFGGLSQAFATTPGQQYQLTFDYSHNPGTASSSPDGAYAARVTIGNANAPTGNYTTCTGFISCTTVSQTGAAIWLAYSEDFTATSSSTLLQLIDTEGGYNAGIYLDDVSVVPLNGTTPIPGALPLFASGAGVLGFIGWRRKKKSAPLAA
jgi:hypothetical protein